MKNNFTKKIVLVCINILIIVIGVYSQQVEVSGIVTSNVDKKTIPGVNVFVKGNKTGVSTDIDGKYKIKLNNPNQTLVFSYLGYNTLEVAVNGRSQVNVELEEKKNILDQMVVVAYQTLKKKDITGAVSVADVEEMKKVTATTTSEALQGRVPGITVKKTGAPGDEADIYIRGISSFNTDTKPLFVIDGLPTNDASSFNPNDIESIQVLKDASAAALYGSRAANGVVIITTKKGKKGEPKLEFSVKTGIQNVSKRFKMMETDEWLEVNRLRYYNKFLRASNGDPAAAQKLMGKFYPAFGDSSVNTNWQDQVYRTGVMKEYNLGISGGSDVLNFMMSGNYFSHKGMLTGQSFDRWTGRINAAYEKGRLRIEENVLLSHTLNAQDGSGGAWGQALGVPSILPVHDSLGQYALGNYNMIEPRTGKSFILYRGTNLVAERERTQSLNRSNAIKGSVSSTFRIFDYLKYKFNFGVDYSSGFNETKVKDGIISATQNPKDTISSYTQSRPLFVHLVYEHLLMFDKTFSGKHNVSAMIGYSRERTDNEGNLSVNGAGVLADNGGKYYWGVDNLMANRTDYPIQVGQYFDYHRLESGFGRVSYNFKSKYYATFSIRRDGSSNFGPEHKYGNFPSGSVAWRISDEKFFKNRKWLKIVEDFKFRTSYGKLGNEGIGSFQYEVYNNPYVPYIFNRSTSENLVFGSLALQMADKGIHWESKKSFNSGFDLSLFKNQFILNFDYYISQSDGLLAMVSIPEYSGVVPIWWMGSTPRVMSNSGKVRNSGVEATLTYRNFNHKLKYSIISNLTTIKNKIIDIPDESGYYTGYWSDIYPIARSAEGRSLGEFYLLKSNGIYQINDPDLNKLTVYSEKAEPGMQKFVDLNNDGNIDDNDRYYCGNPWPKLEYSLNLSLEYLKFDFTIYCYGVRGRKVLNTSLYDLYNTNNDGNYISGLMDKVWTPTNPDGNYIYPEKDREMLRQSDQFLQNGNFMRIKTVQLGYTLENKKYKKLGFERIRFALSGENLYTWTKYSGLDADFKGLKPHAIGLDAITYPLARSFYFTIQANF